MDGSAGNTTLARERFDKGLTVEKAAKQMGVSPDLLRRAERGEHRPRPAAALKIASFYDLKPSAIWPIGNGGDNDPESKEAAA